MNTQWKLVPVEPTETMVINGFESEPNECFTDDEVWEQYQGMSGCQQAAFRAKLCWAAMLGSAPSLDTLTAAPEESAGVDFGIDGRSVRVSQEAYSIFLAREVSAREKIEALQQRLNAADQRIDELERGQREPVMKLEAERLLGGDGEYAVSFVKAGWLEECRKAGGEFLLYTNPPAPALVVPELTSELRWILGQMCFQHIRTAQALRLMGHEIAKKAEDEQAVTIYWMLSHYLKDPDNWRKNAAAEMKAAAPAA